MTVTSHAMFRIEAFALVFLIVTRTPRMARLNLASVANIRYSVYARVCSVIAASPITSTRMNRPEATLPKAHTCAAPHAYVSDDRGHWHIVRFFRDPVDQLGVVAHADGWEWPPCQETIEIASAQPEP